MTRMGVWGGERNAESERKQALGTEKEGNVDRKRVGFWLLAGGVLILNTGF